MIQYKNLKTGHEYEFDNSDISKNEQNYTNWLCYKIFVIDKINNTLNYKYDSNIL